MRFPSGEEVQSASELKTSSVSPKTKMNEIILIFTHSSFICCILEMLDPLGRFRWDSTGQEPLEGI